MFEIGQTVWHARTKNVERWATCPDCCGDRYITIIMGDGKQYSIDCENCKRGGYEEYSVGSVKYYDHVTDVKKSTIVRVEKKSEGYEYGLDDFYCVDDNTIFENKEDAEKRVIELIAQRDDESYAKSQQKHDHRKTWAWNASYHRRCLKRAQTDIEYHIKKLTVAARLAKINTPAPSGSDEG